MNGVNDKVREMEKYGVIKYEEGKQRFSFLTGVSKFSKVSIFSDLNNLKDYTLHPLTATLFGFTHEEVRKYYPRKLAELGAKFGKGADWAFDEIVRMYDGYKFEENAETVINPVSLGQTFDSMKFENGWSKTATDAYVIEVKRDSTPMKAIEQIRDKSYTDKFRLAGKPITLIGLAFSTKKRAVSGAKIVRDA